MSSMEEVFAMLDSCDDQPIVREQFVRAPFGYPGSKWKSLDKILPHLPHRIGYIEPFGGSGCVLLSRNESPLEVFNDRFAGVVAFYRCLKDYKKLQAMVDWLDNTLHAREEFIWCKNTWKDCEDDVERACRWYYMVCMSFNKQGRHFGRATTSRNQMAKAMHNNLQLFHPVHMRLKNCQIENQDWREILKDFDGPNNVFYLDPPYYDYAKGMYEHDLKKADHHEMLHRVMQMRGFVAVSGYSHPAYEVLPWDNVVKWLVPVTSLGQGFQETANLAGKEDLLKRGLAEECLYIKEAK